MANDDDSDDPILVVSDTEMVITVAPASLDPMSVVSEPLMSKFPVT